MKQNRNETNQNRRLWEEVARTYGIPQPTGDGLDWARKIVNRISAGEKLSTYSELLAREALGLSLQREPGED